jgi:hypothetical protein
MNLAGESIWRKPFGHRIRIEKRFVNPLRLGAENPVKFHNIGFVCCHNRFVFVFIITTNEVFVSGH